MELAPVPGSARAARGFVARTLASWGDAELVDEAALLVSELVTNAIVHARTPVELAIDDRGSRAVLRVEVGDTGAGLPARREVGPDALSGRGLAIVAALATSWGVDVTDAGKVVWFELTNVKPADDQTGEDQPTDDVPADDVPTDDVAADDVPADGQAVDQGDGSPGGGRIDGPAVRLDVTDGSADTDQRRRN